MSPILYIILAVIIVGALSGFVGTSSLKAELKSVAPKTQANSYVVGGSLHISRKRETFMYSKESKRELPKKPEQ